MSEQPISPETDGATPPSQDTARPKSFAARVFGKTAYGVAFVLQPLLAVAAITGLVVMFGWAQKQGYFLSADASNETGETIASVEHFCPMMCVPPVKAAGRCPVCGMELQEREISSDSKDFYGLTIAPASRRLSNIQTVTAVTKPLLKQINTLGTITYNESSEAVISAWINGRLDELYVDYTGAEVTEGEPLALLYSPDLYSMQVELLESKNAMNSSKSNSQRLVNTNQKLYEGARRRLLEFGVPAERIEEMEQAGKASSQVQIVSPVAGTVVEKIASEGNYVKMGSPILRVVDLSKVWLILKIFPEDASLLRYGQQVDVTLQSQPGRKYQGRVAFIDPMVDTNTQTVSVRVVIPNESRLIRIGDYARATAAVDVSLGGEKNDLVYDPQLANKWISPKHPYIIRDEPGVCPECGIALVATSEFGFASEPLKQQGAVVVPRQAILMSGDASVAYVETEPGRFEFRKVQLGPISGNLAAIVSGIEAGENVVSRAAFMVDAEFNIASKPSIIDPDKKRPIDETDAEITPEQPEAIREALSQLSELDRDLALAQVICPVTEFALGSMGPPIKVRVDNQNVLICCEGCRDRLIKDPQNYFSILERYHQKEVSPEELAAIETAFAPLTGVDRQRAVSQSICPVTEMRLGSMGTPIKVDVKGEPVFICCEACRDPLLAEPDRHLNRLTGSGGNSAKQSGADDLPKMNLPKMDLPKMDLPKMDLPK